MINIQRSTVHFVSFVSTRCYYQIKIIEIIYTMYTKRHLFFNIMFTLRRWLYSAVSTAAPGETAALWEASDPPVSPQ